MEYITTKTLFTFNNTGNSQSVLYNETRVREFSTDEVQNWKLLEKKLSLGEYYFFYSHVSTLKAYYLEPKHPILIA